MNENITTTPGTRLRAMWTVHAGVIPELPVTMFTRKWSLTSEAFEADSTLFNRFRDEASAYAGSLISPGLNWVRLEYIYL